MKIIIVAALLLLVCLFDGKAGKFRDGNDSGPGADTLFSIMVDKTDYFVLSQETKGETSVAGRLKVAWQQDSSWQDITRWKVVFRNSSATDTVVIENFVPYGVSPGHVYITSTGPAGLARAGIFRPGCGPIGLILPDNAWESGFGFKNRKAAFARRTSWQQAQRRRYETHVFPGGTVTYTLWERPFEGTWQEALRTFCQKDYLFDLKKFDESLYQRNDLAWIKKAKLIYLVFAWDPDFYDRNAGKYTLPAYLQSLESTLGKTDIAGIWPTWPRLGLDERNQWDLYRDLPGGLPAIHRLADTLNSHGTRLFISYNPWDESTRAEDQLKGMSELIGSTNADGVVLDTRGASSYELQAAADKAKTGVVMYSEGMAVVKDMPGIISGRVHDAIQFSPQLNLNKYIRPDFAIFRVCQVADGELHREVAISLFNGYGTEINAFASERPAWIGDEFTWLGKTLRILKENNAAFMAKNWTPLLITKIDSVWVNHFPVAGKDIFTVLSFKPGGFEGGLFEWENQPGRHWVSLWRHDELNVGGTHSIPVSVEPYLKSYTGTRREGTVDVIASLPELIAVKITSDSLIVNAKQGDKFEIWKGDPSNQTKSVEFKPGNYSLLLSDFIGEYQGKLTIQLFEGKELLDERILFTLTASARATGKPVTALSQNPSEPGMKLVHATNLKMPVENPDTFIPYPNDTLKIEDHSYWIDMYPVTNGQFATFLEKSGYKPREQQNFLKHWINGKCPDSLANHPVTWINADDALAYAKWAGKRLPTEAEWQFAGSGSDNRPWPWGAKFDSTRCNINGRHTLPVDYFGNSGESPSGVRDMVGNIWQLTADTYLTGKYTYRILKGGSYWHPTSSWWYIAGGPQSLQHRQILLEVSPGFDRSSTVGFRCVKDVGK